MYRVLGDFTESDAVYKRCRNVLISEVKWYLENTERAKIEKEKAEDDHDEEEGKKKRKLGDGKSKIQKLREERIKSSASSRSHTTSFGDKAEAIVVAWEDAMFSIEPEWFLDTLGLLDQKGKVKKDFQWVEEALGSEPGSSCVLNLAELDPGKIYAKLYKEHPEVVILALSVGGQLSSESFSERIVSAVNLCQTKQRERLSNKNTKNLSMGRTNRDFRVEKREERENKVKYKTIF